MKRLTANPYLSWIVGLSAAYWVTGLSFPGPWLSAVVSGALLVSGLFVFLTYITDAYRVVRAGVIGDGQLALIGVTLVAAGSAYSGAFGLAWAFAGNPSSWLGTAFSTFGRATMVPGFALFLLSPNVTREGIRPPRWWIICIGVMGIAIVAFLLGVSFRADEESLNALERQATLASCADTMPIKANIAGRERIYHVPHGLSYARTKPEGCFASERDAIAAGFRPSG